MDLYWWAGVRGGSFTKFGSSRFPRFSVFSSFETISESLQRSFPFFLSHSKFYLFFSISFSYFLFLQTKKYPLPSEVCDWGDSKCCKSVSIDDVLIKYLPLVLVQQSSLGSASGRKEIVSSSGSANLQTLHLRCMPDRWREWPGHLLAVLVDTVLLHPWEATANRRERKI